MARMMSKKSRAMSSVGDKKITVYVFMPSDHLMKAVVKNELKAGAVTITQKEVKDVQEAKSYAKSVDFHVDVCKALFSSDTIIDHAEKYVIKWVDNDPVNDSGTSSAPAPGSDEQTDAAVPGPGDGTPVDGVNPLQEIPAAASSQDTGSNDQTDAPVATMPNSCIFVSHIDGRLVETFLRIENDFDIIPFQMLEAGDIFKIRIPDSDFIGKEGSIVFKAITRATKTGFKITNTAKENVDTYTINAISFIENEKTDPGTGEAEPDGEQEEENKEERSLKTEEIVEIEIDDAEAYHNLKNEVDKYERLKNEASVSAAEYNRMIKDQYKIMIAASHGKATRPVKCRIEYDWKNDVKKWIPFDGEEPVRIEEITDTDREINTFHDEMLKTIEEPVTEAAV